MVTTIPDSYGTITRSTSNGNWNNAGSWDNGVPSCGDTIIIDTNTTVTVTAHINLDENSGCSNPIHLEIYGTLSFNTGRKMYLPCNSLASISGIGMLLKGNGGGNSNVIDICQTTVWNAGDGPQSGPTTYGTGNPLPITLVNFTARFREYDVVIEWTTASEINNHFFTIERSYDARNFEIISVIKGAGNSNTMLRYESFDNSHQINGYYYYRLKQTDFNGDFSYSEIVAVLYKQKDYEAITIAPNPANRQFQFILRGIELNTAQVMIYDSRGNLIKTLSNHSISEPINISDLNSGMYYMHLYNLNDELLTQQKLVVL